MSSDRSRFKNPRAGFSLIEMLIVLAIIGVILAFAVPKLEKALRGARETAAMKAVTTLQTAEVQYYSSYNRFAVSLQELGPPAGGAEGPSAAGLINQDLASGEKGGYKFALTVTPTGYAITATPTSETNGSKSYFSDQSMGIHVHDGQQVATPTDPLLGEAAAATTTPQTK